MSWFWFIMRIYWHDLWVWDKSQRALVIIRRGHRINFEIAKRKRTLSAGDEYEYKRHVIYVPPPVGWDWLGSERRIIGVTDGEVICTPFKGTGLQVDEQFVSDIVRGSVMTKLMASFTGSIFNWKWLLIIGIVGVIGYVVYTQFIAGGGTPMPTPTPTPYNVGGG